MEGHPPAARQGTVLLTRLHPPCHKLLRDDARCAPLPAFNQQALQLPGRAVCATSVPKAGALQPQGPHCSICSCAVKPAICFLGPGLMGCCATAQVLAAFLKCIGHIIPLMDAVYANYYTREVMFILVREFQTPDEEMKKIVLKVVKQCVGTEGVEPEYIRTDILGPFFANFWVRRMALDRRNYRQLVETTVELANKVLQAALFYCAIAELATDASAGKPVHAVNLHAVLVGLMGLVGAAEAHTAACSGMEHAI